MDNLRKSANAAAWKTKIDAILDAIGEEIEFVFADEEAEFIGPFADFTEWMDDMRVHLPEAPLEAMRPLTLEITDEFIESAGVEADEEAREIYIILHEIGHVVDFRSRLKRDIELVEKEIEKEEEERNNHCLRKYGEVTEKIKEEDEKEFFLLYANSTLEKMAHDYAKANLKKALAALKDKLETKRTA